MGMFSKKHSGDAGAEAGDEKQRSALFGSRSKSKDSKTASPAPSNPYAQQEAPPAYSGGGGRDQWRQDKTPAANQGGGYGAAGGSYGQGNGYGSNPYGGGGAAPARPGGYGGMGSTGGNSEAARNELFGGAAQRQQDAPPQQAYGGSGGGYGDDANQGYGAYEDRQMTAEEQEEEDVTAAKQEMKHIKQQDISSTRNALRLAQQAEETGLGTLNRLGQQGERIHNTERNLDLSSSQNRIAEEKARELKRLNGSMFAMHVSNPFTSRRRAEERDEKVMETHRKERDEREATRAAAWGSAARQGNVARGMQGERAAQSNPKSKASLAERAKYQFEADSDDDKMEDEIDGNLDDLHDAARRLNRVGRAMGSEVDQQNQHITRIIGKTDKVDDQIAMNRAKLERIK